MKGRNFQLEIKGVCRLVSQHAIDRYRERLDCKKADATIRGRIQKKLALAKEIHLLPQYEAAEILKHGRPSRFFRYGSLIFAVRDEVIVTLHEGEAERWA